MPERKNLLIVNVDKDYKEKTFNLVMDLYKDYKKLGNPTKDADIIIVKHDAKTVFTVGLFFLAETQEGEQFRILNGVTPFFREEESEYEYEG